MIKKYIEKRLQKELEFYDKRFNDKVQETTERVLGELPQTVENILFHVLREIKNNPNPSGFARDFKESITPLVLRALESELKQLKDKNSRLYEAKIKAKKTISNAHKDEAFIQRIIDEINKKQLKK